MSVVIPVRLAPLIAGKAPVSLLEVKVEILASATVPVKFPAGNEVKFAPLAVGNVAGNLASAIVPVSLSAEILGISAASKVIAVFLILVNAIS
jgi:hypothetical protein